MNLDDRTSNEKPYNICLDCAHLGTDCDGPNFLAMTSERWCEWCHLRKERLGWTNAKVAEYADVSLASVARIMSGDIKDIRISTMQAVTKALVNGSWGQYPCFLASMEDAVAERCQQLQQSLDDEISAHREEKETREKALADLREYDEKRLDYLKQQIASKDELLLDRFRIIKSRDRVVIILSILLGISVLAVIAFLSVEIADLTNPDWGRYQSAAYLADQLFWGL